MYFLFTAEQTRFINCCVSSLHSEWRGENGTRRRWWRHREQQQRKLLRSGKYTFIALLDGENSQGHHGCDRISLYHNAVQGTENANLGISSLEDYPVHFSQR